MLMLELVFWGGLGCLLYTYLGYPVALFLIARLSPVRPRESFLGTPPRVTMVIAAYNEAKVIAGKIENCLGLDYPAEKLDFVVASDGSSDGTDEIVSAKAGESSRIRLLPLPRGGKASAINAAMKEATGEIIVFSDANTIYSHNAIEELVRHFSDSETGCVCGRLSYRNPGEVVSGKGESAYWRYETALKEMESRLGYVAGANGAIYAIRRDLFAPLPTETINDDFLISMRIVKSGKWCLYEKNAVAYEEVAPDTASEFRRHIRDGAGHYIAIRQLVGLLNPFLGMRSFVYWSHRILRWVAPFILVCVFVLNMLLAEKHPYSWFLAVQITFYLFALLGYAVSGGKSKVPFVLYVPFYFSNLNLALFLGFLKTLTSRIKPAWGRTQRG